MKRIRVKMVGSGTKDDPYRVDLPNYIIVKADTDRGIRPPNAYAVVIVPDDELTPGGRISRAKIKKKYRGFWWERHEPKIGSEKPV